MVFELDLAGGAEVLKEMAADMIADLAAQVAAAAGPSAEVKMRVTDRARASVTVPAEAQAVDGVLTRAATTVGLEVVARKPRESGGKTRTRRSGGKSRRPRPKASPVEAAASGDANEAWVAARRAQRAQRKAGR
ncbi:hypothetical protein PP713_08650 [Mycobacterium sp. CSUR Q5927]|nr:hypothetical protein [Mycobacterium sp. CSUR Q5927]